MGEQLLRVAIYHAMSGKVDQEFVVRAKQPVTDLFDHPSFFCASEPAQQSGSTLFIGGIFYEDRRRATSGDVPATSAASSAAAAALGGSAGNGSAEARAQWLRTRGATISVRDAHGVCFGDLEVQLGAHYEYAHGGGCSHILSFTDAWLAYGGDVESAAEYPVHVFQAKRKRQRCDACAAARAQLTVLGSAHAAQPLMLLCERCFVELHYDAEGALAPGSAKLRAYPYSLESGALKGTSWRARAGGVKE